MLGRSRNEVNYWISTQTRSMLIAEEGDIKSTADIYNYVRETVLPHLLPETDARGNELPEIEKYYVNGNSKLMGGIRFQTRRVAAKKCEVPRASALFDLCYPDYSWANRDTEDFIVNSSWSIKWRSVEDTKGATWIGFLNKYDGSGYTVDLPKNQANATAIINQLEEANFVDRQTRAIFIDFNLFHPAYNLDTIGRIALEMPAAGGIFPKLEIKTWRLNKYYGKDGQTYMMLEILFWIGVAWYTFEELFQLITSSVSTCLCWKIFESYSSIGDYFSDAVNILDLSNVLFFLLYGAFRIYGNAYEKENINYSDMEFKYVSLRFVQRLNSSATYLTAINGWLLCIKIFKYLNWNERFRFLFKILRSASTDLLVFLLVLFVIMLAFGMFGYLSFASDVRDYRTIATGLGNLFRYIVSEMDYDELDASNSLIGNFFYIMWNIMMIVILVNVLIAILCDAYADVTQEAALNDNAQTFELGNFLTDIRKRVSRVFKWGIMGTDKNQDGKISKHELAVRLNVDTNAAQTVLDKYDPDKNGFLGEEEYNQMMTKMDLDGNGNMSIEEVASGVSRAKTYVSPSGPLFKSRALLKKSPSNAPLLARMDRIEELLLRLVQTQTVLPPLTRLSNHMPNGNASESKK